MAAPVKKSLEQRLAQQLRLRSDGNDVASTINDISTHKVAIPHSRLLERARHNVRIRTYLKEHDPTFRRLDELREKGWSAASGDDHFKKQREAADNKDDSTEVMFHALHLRIGHEMRDFGAFEVNTMGASKTSALNLCLAPGAYTAAMLDRYPDASVCGITLPFSSGGHKMVIPYGSEDPRVEVEFLDITMLINEFMEEPISIPANHPDAANFVSISPFHDQIFDLVLCDGQALRTHNRAEYRDTHEPRRLLAAQLVFGMTRINQGGTFVILLHKADAWDTIRLLKSSSSFAQIKLFKPKAGHRQRSTFYLIAKNVQPDSIEALRSIDEWKRSWYDSTFGGEERRGADPTMPDDAEVDELLHEFGPHLIAMAQDIWSIQIDALKHSQWLPGAGAEAIETRRRPSLQLGVPSEHGEPSTPRHSDSVRGARTRWPPSSARSSASPGTQIPVSPLNSRSGNQPKYLGQEVDENKAKKMAGRWR
ncbi:MAG: hypothetical protein Q9209_002191 [Squamulea sp. 1 TL-2023]